MATTWLSDEVLGTPPSGRHWCSVVSLIARVALAGSPHSKSEDRARAHHPVRGCSYQRKLESDMHATAGLISVPAPATFSATDDWY